jgi:hypothetical protein
MLAYLYVPMCMCMCMCMCVSQRHRRRIVGRTGERDVRLTQLDGALLAQCEVFELFCWVSKL